MSRIPRETFYIGTKVVITSQFSVILQINLFETFYIGTKVVLTAHTEINLFKTFYIGTRVRSQIISKFTICPGWTLCSFVGEGI